MDIITSKLYEKQLKTILETIIVHSYEAAKGFKTYLDTIILNIPTKEKKYKKSIYFDNENIRDVEFRGCVIIVLIDREKSCLIILGITTKS